MVDHKHLSAPPVGDKAFDYDAYVAQHWPELPAAQAHSVATYLYLGWVAGSIGKAGEFNLEKSGEASAGYVRTDGSFRNA